MYAAALFSVFAAGAAIGLAYMELLWRTVLLVPGVRRPVMLLAASFFLRAALAAGALYAAAGPDAVRLCAGALGFATARMLVVGCVRRRAASAGGNTPWTS